MISHAEIHDLMRSRRSVRRFRPEVPAPSVIESVLASAITAPSASNKQPWRFLIVENREAIARIAAAVREAVGRVALAVEPQFEPAFRAYGDYFTRFECAPVVIVPLFQPLTLLTTLTGPRLCEEDRRLVDAMERDSGLIGTSLAMQNLLLAAHAAGLGASGMTGPLIAADAIREILGISRSWHIAALVPIGYPDEEPAQTQRKSVEHVTRWVR